MSESGPIEVAKASTVVLGEIVRAAGDHPGEKEAAANIGATAVTLTKAINNALLPLAAINFAFDRARNYFEAKFADDLASRTASIPNENLIEPKASVAGPALQGLAFTHEEESLKDLYLRLIATAMDNSSSEIGHPAFVEILKQLDSDDARLIIPILRQAIPIPIVQLRTETDEGNTSSVIANHVLNLRNESGEPSPNDRVPAIADNWIRLRLVEVDYTMFFPTGDRYDWVEGRPELAEARKVLYVAGTKVVYQPGILQRTKFGEQFARAVGLIEK